MKIIIQFWERYKYAVLVLIQGLIFKVIFKLNFLLYIAIFISILCFIFPKVLESLTKFEEFIAKNIAQLINTILLSLVYLLIVLPIGIVKRISKKKTEGTLIVKEHTFSLKDFKNPW